MERAITGYHLDTAGDWIAELSCGHNQHVRHRPPFQERAWVLTDRGRTERLGTPLLCPLCDRAELPEQTVLVRTSPEWDEETLPPGLRRAHRLAPGTWGKILIADGALRFSMASEPPLAVDVGAGQVQAIPPEVDHEVRPLGPVRFSIDFLAVDRQRTPRAPAETAPTLGGDADQGGDPACWAGLVCPDCGAVLGSDGHRPGCQAVDG